MEVLCTACGKAFNKDASEIRRFKNHYCSQACYLATVKKPEVPCGWCGTTVSGGAKFCSRSCAAKHNNRHFPKRVKIQQSTCKICGVALTKQSQREFCGNTCAGQAKHNKHVEAWLSGETTGLDSGLTATETVRKYLQKTRGNKCESCGWCQINLHTGRVPLQVDHIDGDWSNNKEGNLRLLCPNCHSLTETYGSGNRGKGRPFYLVKKLG